MSSQPECEQCGVYILSGYALCSKCAEEKEDAFAAATARAEAAEADSAGLLDMLNDSHQEVARLSEKLEVAEADADRLAEELRNVARQLDNGLARKLGSNGPPGHVDYISKLNAANWARQLAEQVRCALAAHDQRRVAGADTEDES